MKGMAAGTTLTMFAGNGNDQLEVGDGGKVERATATFSSTEMTGNDVATMIVNNQSPAAATLTGGSLTVNGGTTAKLLRRRDRS